ncbi:histone H4 [Schizosaccharomyces cryophilus OY26]|uniref:Histone H4 n=1 Tax=Schizosaccharomyces cryophilus (strain OY26 / ATCC MYA-4695 / CBS 11777 / NBRC 106824 / NRRL Y48691) TaxID=653667 RepID=S9W5B1_SCHCR|nr:histone H4 [Schizosaccharomyces cryophilus OY26]EPY53115.1 histone H4 [Schizosaccharomyces cryophilus OY26]
MNNPGLETPIRSTSFNHLMGTLSQKKLFTPSRNRTSLSSAQRTVTPHKQRALARKSALHRRKSNIPSNKTPRDILRVLSRALAKQPIPSPAETSGGSSQKKRRRTSSTMPIAPPSRNSLSRRSSEYGEGRVDAEEADLTVQSIEAPRRYSARMSDIFTPDSRRFSNIQNPYAFSKSLETGYNHVQESALSNSPDQLLDVGDDIPVFRLPLSDYETADAEEETPSTQRANTNLNQYQSPIFTLNSDLLENEASFSKESVEGRHSIHNPSITEPRFQEGEERLSKNAGDESPTPRAFAEHDSIQEMEEQQVPDAESHEIDEMQGNTSPISEPVLEDSLKQQHIPDVEPLGRNEMQGNTSPISEPVLADLTEEDPPVNEEINILEQNINLLDKDGFKKPKRRSRKSSSATLPDSNLRKLANAYSRKNISSSVIEELSSVSEHFFKQVAEDLSAYADHAHRKTIETDDVCLLLKRQRKIQDKVSLMALQRSYLSREIRPLPSRKR